MKKTIIQLLQFSFKLSFSNHWGHWRDHIILFGYQRFCEWDSICHEITLFGFGIIYCKRQENFELFNQESVTNFRRLAGHIYSAADLRKLEKDDPL
jgi:hypothetical protein